MKKSLISLISAILCLAMVFGLAACAPVAPENDDPVIDNPADDLLPDEPDTPELPEEPEVVTPNTGNASDSEVTEDEVDPPLVDATPATDGLKFKLTDDGKGYKVFTYTGTETNVYIPFAYLGLPVVAIGYKAFDETPITSVNIPDTVKSIDQYAFNRTAISTVHIPASVSEIAELAFIDNELLETVTVDSDNPVYRVVENCLVKGDTIVLGVKQSVIPNDPTVTAIANGAFRGASIVSVSIPENIKTFGKGIFIGCKSLSTVSFYTGLEKIEDSMFVGCESLASVEIPNTVKTIGARAFQSCSKLLQISIPASVITISQYAFADCGLLNTVNLENGVTTIGGSAFKNCSSLASIVIPDSVVSIGAVAFWECRSLASVSLGTSSSSRLGSLGGGAFYNCSALREIFIPESVYELGVNLFWGCSYTETDDDGKVVATFTVKCEKARYLKEEEWGCGAKILYNQTRP